MSNSLTTNIDLQQEDAQQKNAQATYNAQTGFMMEHLKTPMLSTDLICTKAF